jgi:hypothetical protein
MIVNPAKINIGRHFAIRQRLVEVFWPGLLPIKKPEDTGQNGFKARSAGHSPTPAAFRSNPSKASSNSSPRIFNLAPAPPPSDFYWIWLPCPHPATNRHQIEG